LCFLLGNCTQGISWIYFVSFSAHWESNNGVGGVPQLKGARCFSFEELKKYTNNFSETNDIGSGEYGKVKFDYLSHSLKAYSHLICKWIFICI
jgi:hypothetical protein